MNKKNRQKIVLLFLTLIVFSCFNDKKPEYDYSFTESKINDRIVNWIFTNKYKPPLNLEDENQFIKDVNSVLDSIGIPRINTKVIEKEKLTKSRYDRAIFEWENYPEGKLIITRNTDKDVNYNTYDCIWKVSIIK